MLNIREKKAISLIILVVTIIVMMILATVIIFTLGKDNPIEEASKAQVVSDIDAFKSEFALYVGRKDADDADFYADSLDGLVGSELEEIIPSMKNQRLGNSNYSNILTVKNGELALQDDYESKVTEKTKKMLEEIFSKAD